MCTGSSVTVQSREQTIARSQRKDASEVLPRRSKPRVEQSLLSVGDMLGDLSTMRKDTDFGDETRMESVNSVLN